MKRLTVIMLLMMAIISSAGAQRRMRSLWHKAFNDPLDTTLWKIEMAPDPRSSVYTDSGKMIIDTKGGVTVWFTRKLTGRNIHISFTRKVLVEGNANDRLSDLNVFWMATDPRNKNLFTRNGVFEAYDSLRLYYVGMGGNTNTTTRFRKYLGNGKKPLLKEYTDSAHLLAPNKEYQIDISIEDDEVTYSVNDVVYFTYKDLHPLKEGYFGFRSTWSRQEISNLRIAEGN